jgi:CheY-like chemotaxis protein
MPKRNNQVAASIVAGVLLALAVVRFLFYYAIGERMDSVFFALVGAAVVLLLIPLDRLKSLKAGGIEVSLDQPQVQGAIAGLGLDRIQNDEMRARLARLEHELGVIHGSRVLWIDDWPHKILGERRLLRALGVEVVQATSSKMAERILEADNDFDLLITDVQRAGRSYEVTGGRRIHEGVNFVVKLRRQHADPVVRALRVIFYAAYPWEELKEWTRPAWSQSPAPETPKPELANSVLDLVPKAVKLLAEARSAPLVASGKKKASHVARVEGEEPEGEEEPHEGEEEEHEEEQEPHEGEEEEHEDEEEPHEGEEEEHEEEQEPHEGEEEEHEEERVK